MNKSTIYISITVILFIVINDPVLKFLVHTFNFNFWVNEIIIVILVVLLMFLISKILNKTVFKNR